MNAPFRPLKYVAPNILAVLPEPMIAAQRWLVWREAPHRKKPGKKVKIPMYSSGQQRSGQMDTEGDIARLTSIHDALSAAPKVGASGIGFAVCGEGVGGLDLDGILDDNGELIPSHAGFQLARKAEADGVYMEVSPSGRGLRAFGPCDDQTAYSADGVEYWGQRRFLTGTGKVWANPQGWVSLNDLRSTLTPPKTEPKQGVGHDGEEDGHIITPKVLDELRGALKHIPADGHKMWVDVGHALKKDCGAKGLALWLEWSATCPEKFDRAEAIHTWDTFKPTIITHKFVFAEATRRGWDNPAKGKKPAAPVDTGFLKPVPLGTMDLEPTEFVLDGFIPTGVSVVAGAWGAGKSTNLIPLFAAVAHLAPEEWGFNPEIRRPVVWVTEAPEQAKDTLRSLARAEGAAGWQEFGEWFHLFAASRRSPKDVAAEVERLVHDLAYTNERGFIVQPVVVLDTTNANLDLDDENDNSEVASAMSMLKQSLPGIPLVLVGHTPKAQTRASVADATFRGAGAWEAEAVATYFLVHDAATDSRFIAIRKCRFTPHYKEVDFSYQSGTQTVPTLWGEPQHKHFLHGVPAKSSGEARQEARREAIEQQREEASARREREAMEAVRRIVDNTDAHPSRNAIVEQAGGMRSEVLAALKRLLEAGALVEHKIDRSRFDCEKGGQKPKILLPADMPLEAYLAMRTGDQNQSPQNGGGE